MNTNVFFSDTKRYKWILIMIMIMIYITHYLKIMGVNLLRNFTRKNKKWRQSVFR